MKFASAGTIVEGCIFLIAIIGLWLLVVKKNNKIGGKK